MASLHANRPFWVLIVLAATAVAIQRATRTSPMEVSITPAVLRATVETAPAEPDRSVADFVPSMPRQEPRVVVAAAPVEAPSADEAGSPSDVARSIEPESELPDAPGGLPFDPACPYGNEYAGMDPKALEEAQKLLRREQEELAAPLLEERLRLGLYTEVSYPEYRLALKSTDIPAWNRPLRLARPTTMGNMHVPDQVRLVEVFPNEVPGVQALRDEELWLAARIEELEAEWSAWLED